MLSLPKKIGTLFLYLVLLTLTACSSFKTYSPGEIKEETKRINVFFEKSFNASLSRNPEFLTHIGRKEKYDQLDDYSDKSVKRELKIARKELKILKSFNYRALDENTKISYLIFRQNKENFISDFKYRFYHYRLSSLYGFHNYFPTFMISKHSIENLKEAKAYIARLKEFRRVFKQIMIHLKTQEQKKIYPPAFVFPKIIETSKNIISGQPFPNFSKENTRKNSFNQKTKALSPLYEDFLKKINQLKGLKQEEKKELRNELTHALLNFVEPSYKEFIEYVKELSKKVRAVHGVWAFGSAFYKNRLQRITTTSMSPEKIHQLGLKHVKHIHEEMRTIQKKLKIKGNLRDFFEFLKTNDEFYYPNTREGRKAYLMEARKTLEEMKGFMPKLFNTFPKAPLIIQPVEKFKEKSSGLAYYSLPSENGKRPGIYYINLSDMKKLPKYETQVLAYHEGIPGHHHQIALALETKNTPQFRRYTRFTAFTEGWGLYSEKLPNEFHLYKDEYSKIGYLNFVLLRATRLVVDTGIHRYRWTKEKAMNYLEENTPFQKAKIETSVERYFLLPGQATAYMVGMLKILEIRDKVKRELKEEFDLRAFHDELLSYGSLPLDILETLMNQFIIKRKRI